MRKHFKIFLTVMMAVFVWISGSISVFAAEMLPVVDTITLDETVLWDSKIPVNLSWKLSQDNDKWLKDLGVTSEVKSLILVIDRPDQEDSRLFYFSYGAEGEWNEVFSVECYISEEGYPEKTAIYGTYEPESAFGTGENPGSLLPYRTVSEMDDWSEDKNSAYGMILHPEYADENRLPLVINCMPKDDDQQIRSGFQVPQEQLRMMIQSVDKESRFVIVENFTDLGLM